MGDNDEPGRTNPQTSKEGMDILRSVKADLVSTGGEEKERRPSLTPSLPPSSVFVTDNRHGHICIRASKRYRMAPRSYEAQETGGVAF